MLSRRARNVNYKSDITISSAINCNSNTELDLSYITTRLELSNLEISDCQNLRSRKKRKLNSTTIAYYYRCLDYSNNILQLEKYGIDLFKKVADRESYVVCIVKKIKQVKYTLYIRLGRRLIELIYSDIDYIKKTKLRYEYFIIFIDDYIKRLEIKVIKKKSDTFKVFIRYLKRNKYRDLRYRRL